MANDIQMSNIPKVTVGSLVDYLAAAYSTVIIRKLPVKSLPPTMLWGPPGVGKSQLVREVAKEIQSKTGKNVKVTDIRLLLYNPIDLRGIPIANEEKTAAIWLKPFVFQMDESEETVNILLLDEITAAPQSVQAAAYQMTLDRRIGEHKLPDNCIVMAAGNRTTDKSVAYKMPKALANRLMHFEVEANFESWRKWAIETGINEKVIGFLSFRQDYLMAFNGASEDLAFATPRSWEMVSNILNSVSGDLERMHPFLAAVLGTGVATEFESWARVYQDMPSVPDIFMGKETRLPKTTDAIYALISSMAVYAKEHKEEMEKIEIPLVTEEILPEDMKIHEEPVLEPTQEVIDTFSNSF